MNARSESDLDGSSVMTQYFTEVAEILVQEGKTEEEARAAIEQYFFIGVDPLERVLVMHRSPREVADDFLAETQQL